MIFHSSLTKSQLQIQTILTVETLAYSTTLTGEEETIIIQSMNNAFYNTDLRFIHLKFLFFIFIFLNLCFQCVVLLLWPFVNNM